MNKFTALDSVKSGGKSQPASTQSTTIPESKSKTSGTNPVKVTSKKAKNPTGALSRRNAEQIFEDELLPHYTDLVKFAVQLTKNLDDAMDLVQETYKKAWKSIDSYTPGTNAKAWLITILRNNFINLIRDKDKGYQTIELDPGIYLKEDDRNNLVDMNALMNTFGDKVVKAIQKLPVDYRITLLLCDIFDFKYDEIAAITNVPIGTVRSRLHRARGLLKKYLAQPEDQPQEKN